jgi:hypothetical protein
MPCYNPFMDFFGLLGLRPISFGGESGLLDNVQNSRRCLTFWAPFLFRDDRKTLLMLVPTLFRSFLLVCAVFLFFCVVCWSMNINIYIYKGVSGL